MLFYMAIYYIFCSICCFCIMLVWCFYGISGIKILSHFIQSIHFSKWEYFTLCKVLNWKSKNSHNLKEAILKFTLFLLRLVFCLLLTLLLAIPILFSFKSIFVATSFTIPYAIYPFDICIKAPIFWKYMKLFFHPPL